MNKLTLGAVGDISFAGRLEELVRKKGDDFAFEHVMGVLGGADVLFGNMESVMAGDELLAEKVSQSVLVGGEHVWKSLRVAGFDVLNQAANHVLDCGWRGVVNTSKRIRNAGAQGLGVDENSENARRMVVVEKKGMRVGFLGYLEPNNCTLEGGGGRVSYFDIDEVVCDVKRSRGEVDILVVSIHADMEFRAGPSMVRVGWCRRIAEAGAGVILCHHPHVPQGIEKWGDCLIAYSLGNFIFKMDDYQVGGSPNTKRSHVLLMDIEDGKVVGWHREYFRIDDKENRPVGLLEDERAEAEEHYRELDEIVADEARLREVWYESSMHYMNMYWNSMVKEGAEGFIKGAGWRVLCGSEHKHWICGIKELAKREYNERVSGDFEFVPPSSPNIGKS